jgi:hypothetical protein
MKQHSTETKTIVVYKNRSKLNRSLVLILFFIGVLLGSFLVVTFQQVNAGKLSLSSYTFSKSSYASLIDSLKSKGYSFGTLDQNYTGGKVVYMVHCADYTFKGEKTFTEVETNEGVKSTYFIRPDSTFFPQTIKTFLALQTAGCAIGYEYDCLNRADNNMTLAVLMFQAQINYLKNLGFNLCATDGHGDMEYNAGKIDSTQIYYEHPELWKQNNLVSLFGDLTVNASYLSDGSFHKIVLPSNLMDKVIIECHTDWY